MQQTKGYRVSSTATAVLIQGGQTQVDGIVIGSHTSGAIELCNGLTWTAAGVLQGTMTLSTIATTGERFIPFKGLLFNTGLFLRTTGTVDITILYR